MQRESANEPCSSFFVPLRWRLSSPRVPGSQALDPAFSGCWPLVKKVEGDGLKLYRRNPKLCTPRDFDYSPYFDIIKYPFLDLSQYAEYHLAPWDGTTGLSEGEQGQYVAAQIKSGDQTNVDYTFE